VPLFRGIAAAPRVPRGYFRTNTARRAGAALDSFEPAPRERLVAQLAGCGAALEGRAAGGHERCGAPDPRRAPKTRRQPHQSSPAQTATKPSNNHGPAPPAGRRAGARGRQRKEPTLLPGEQTTLEKRPRPASGKTHAALSFSPNAAAERSDSSSGRAAGVRGRARRGDGSRQSRRVVDSVASSGTKRRSDIATRPDSRARPGPAGFPQIVTHSTLSQAWTCATTSCRRRPG